MNVLDTLILIVHTAVEGAITLRQSSSPGMATDTDVSITPKALWQSTTRMG